MSLIAWIVAGDLYTLAALALVLMKAQGLIRLPWHWVTAPLWLPIAFAAFLAGMYALTVAADWLVEYIYSQRERA